MPKKRPKRSKRCHEPRISKQARSYFDPSSDKQANPRVLSTNNQRPVWQIGRLDIDGRPWSGNLLKSIKVLKTIFDALKNYESMTWAEIEKDKKYNHSVAVNDIIKPAFDRLSELKLDDIDSLFRFRIGAKGRLWGIRIGTTFMILWWDSDHQICPSAKK